MTTLTGSDSSNDLLFSLSYITQIDGEAAAAQHWARDQLAYYCRLLMQGSRGGL